MKKVRLRKSPAYIEAQARRMKVWRHNSFFGFAAMSYRQMQSIIESETVTDAAKARAAYIQQELSALRAELKERKK